MPAAAASRILVIEPDGPMRALLHEWLAQAGHEVQARSAAGTRGDADVNLVVLDLCDLPTLGADTVHHARKLFPNAGLLGLTTQAARALPARALRTLAPGLAALLPKPCARRELLAAAEAALVHGGGAR